MMSIVRFAAEQVDVSVLPAVSSTSRSPIEVGLEIFFGIMGAVLLLIIILAGLKYITSQGDPDKAARAKDSIIYAAIGLAVILTAYGIVSFVINRVTQ